MKGFKLAAAAGIAAIGLGVAGVATANTVTFNLTGNVSGACVVTDNTFSENVDVAFGDLGVLLDTTIVQVDVGLQYTCNLVNGFDRNIHSANSGVMLLSGGDINNAAHKIDYEVSHTSNTAGFGFGWTPLTGDIFSDALTGVNSAETISFRTTGVVDSSSFVSKNVSGDYDDTVTLTIVAN